MRRNATALVLCLLVAVLASGCRSLPLGANRPADTGKELLPAASVSATEAAAFAARYLAASGVAADSRGADANVATVESLVDFKGLVQDAVDSFPAKPGGDTVLARDWRAYAAGHPNHAAVELVYGSFIPAAGSKPSAPATAPASVQAAARIAELYTYPLLSLGLDAASVAAIRATGGIPPKSTATPVGTDGLRVTMTTFDPETGKGKSLTVVYSFLRTPAGLRLTGLGELDAAALRSLYGGLSQDVDEGFRDADTPAR